MVKFVKYVTAFAIVFAIVGVCLLIARSSHDTANVSFRSPVNMNGSWHQNANDNTPATMTADIDNGHIQVMMESNVISGLYWDGSLDTKNMYDPCQAVSTSDSAALSQSTTKTFYYKNGDLSFVFTMLGKSYTVHMSRGE